MRSLPPVEIFKIVNFHVARGSIAHFELHSEKLFVFPKKVDGQNMWKSYIIEWF